MTRLVSSSDRFGIRLGSLLLALLAALGGSLSACAVGDENPVDDDVVEQGDRELNGRVAHLTVVTRNALGRAEVPVAVAAQFVQFDGVEGRSVRRSLDLWTPPALSEGECLLRDDATMLDPRDWYTSRIDLLHAGELRLETEARAFDLRPRPMPDLLPYLGGFTYGTDGREPLAYQPGLRLGIWSEGGDDVGSFEVVVSMPPPISLAYVDGSAVGSTEALDVRLDDDLLVLWEPSTSDEPVYLVIEEDGLERGPQLTCVAHDDGAFRVPRAAVEGLQSAGPTSPLRLTVRRARVADMRLSDFDRSEALAITEHTLVIY